MNWKLLEHLDQLETIESDSFTTAQAIFKHSTSCPISHMAKNRLETSWNLTEVAAHYLDLLRHRDISASIAEKYGVTHESPQIIVIKNGKAIFDESHLDISVKDIASSISQGSIS